MHKGLQYSSTTRRRSCEALLRWRTGLSRDAAMAQARGESIAKNKATNEATFVTKSEAESIDISSKSVGL